MLTNLETEISEVGVVQWEIADHLPVFVKLKLSKHNIFFNKNLE